MAEVEVILLYTSRFGSQGTGNDNFDLTSGICTADNKLFIVDKQNHRVKIQDLDGVFISEFGSIGSGNDNFFFPEGITTDGTYLYIVDGANHRIKTHDLDGVFVAEFGTEGAGNDNFSYPVGITMLAGDLWIADKQNNRIKSHTSAGVFVLEITGFLFPEGVATINGEVVVADSANDNIDFYTPSGSFLRRSPAVLEYPTQIKETNGVLTVLDKQASRLAFLEADGAFIKYFGSVGGGIDQFLFPADVLYLNDTLYISDSGNYHIEKYDFTIETEIPEYSDLFLRLTKRLYPTGRAWWMRKNGVFEKFSLGLAYSESRVKTVMQGLLNSIIPDNNSFTTADAARWEQALALFNKSDLDLETRKEAIIRKMRFPGGAPARQHFMFLQGELQNAGFNVYVHENRFGDPPAVVTLAAAIYGQIKYGQMAYGSQGITGTRIANYIKEDKDASFNFGNSVNARATFFIGGATYPSRANVELSRKAEFRELILKTKPAQTAGILLIDFVEFGGIGFEIIEDTLTVG